MSESLTEHQNIANIAPSFDMGGGYRVHVPAPEQENRIGIRTIDWCRLRRSVSTIKRPPVWIANSYSALFGITGSGVLILFTIWQASGLPPWVIPFSLVVTVFSLLTATTLLLVDSYLINKQESDVHAVMEDMDEVEGPFKHLLK